MGEDRQEKIQKAVRQVNLILQATMDHLMQSIMPTIDDFLLETEDFRQIFFDNDDLEERISREFEKSDPVQRYVDSLERQDDD